MPNGISVLSKGAQLGLTKVPLTYPASEVACSCLVDLSVDLFKHKSLLSSSNFPTFCHFINVKLGQSEDEFDSESASDTTEYRSHFFKTH